MQIAFDVVKKEHLELRYLYANKMVEQGVQDWYIDACCGRTPKSVLARHYTDYSPERLKRIYDKLASTTRHELYTKS